MAREYLDRICSALDSLQGMTLAPFRAADKIGTGSAAEHACEAFAALRPLLSSEHGINVRNLSNEDITAFVKGTPTTVSDWFSAEEYQDMVHAIVKYAALRARHACRNWWGLGTGISTAGALAFTAAIRLLPVAAGPAGLIAAAAAPVGVAVGVLAIGLDGMKRDRKRACSHARTPPCTPIATDTPAAPASTEAAAALEADGAEAEELAPIAEAAEAEAPADAAAADDAAPLAPDTPMVGCGNNSSEPLTGAVAAIAAIAATVSAPAEQDTMADAPAKADMADVSPVVKQFTKTAPISLAAISPADSASEVPAPADLPLPELLRSATPDPPVSPSPEPPTPSVSETPYVGSDPFAAASAQLPPLALKKKPSATKALKKSFSKSYKSLKKSLSISSSTDLDAITGKDIDAVGSAKSAKKTPFLRRSFSKDGDDLSVHTSDGSQTMQKMRDFMRRSLTLSTPRASMDVKAARAF